MHTHRSLTQSILRLASEMRLHPDTVFYVCLPMFFAGATSSMATPCLRGCTMVIDDFTPEAFLAAIDERHVDATIMVPTMINQVMRHVGDDVNALKGMTNWCYAGDAMPLTELQNGLSRLGKVFSGYYGQLESALVGSSFLSEDHVVVGGNEHRLRSAGRPTIGIELRVVDLETELDVPRDGQSPGEIWIRSPTLMKGYWRRPGLTVERLAGAWLRTTDLATWDEDGYLYLVDRATDMIITGGINVFPREVENVIQAHPKVNQVAVVGRPSDEWGQVVTACVMLASPTDQETLRTEIVALCADQLAGYKKPRRVLIREEMPMTGSGKINKATLRAALRDEMHKP